MLKLLIKKKMQKLKCPICGGSGREIDLTSPTTAFTEKVCVGCDGEKYIKIPVGYELIKSNYNTNIFKI